MSRWLLEQFYFAIVAISFALGYFFKAFAWLEENIGNGAAPAAIILFALPLIAIPLIRGMFKGVREANDHA